LIHGDVLLAETGAPKKRRRYWQKKKFRESADEPNGRRGENNEANAFLPSPTGVTWNGHSEQPTHCAKAFCQGEKQQEQDYQLNTFLKNIDRREGDWGNERRQVEKSETQKKTRGKDERVSEGEVIEKGGLVHCRYEKVGLGWGIGRIEGGAPIQSKREDNGVRGRSSPGEG